MKEYDIENYETKKLFHDIIFDLERKGLIFYSWKQHENGNILNEIWLNKENVENAYLEAGRVAIVTTNKELLQLLESISFKQIWIEQYRKDMIDYLEQKHKPNQLFPAQFANDILKVLQIIDSSEENLKRVLSVKCFGDSKYFEKNLEHIIIRIIKMYLLGKETDLEIKEVRREDIR